MALSQNDKKYIEALIAEVLAEQKKGRREPITFNVNHILCIVWAVIIAYATFCAGWSAAG